MSEFVGQSGNLLLFTGETQAVVIDNTLGVVVRSGDIEPLTASGLWTEGEFTDLDANLASESLNALERRTEFAADTEKRMYTIPRGAQSEAKKALAWRKENKRGGTPVGLNTARTLAKGGQISLQKVRHIAKYFPRHEVDKKGKGWAPGEDGFPSNGRIAWALWGGDSAQRWASAIVERENKKSATTASGVTDAALGTDEPFYGPEFIARVQLEGGGIDRLYKIDFDNRVYVWDGSGWDDMSYEDADIWSYDDELDDELADVTHVPVDPESAIVISAKLTAHPFSTVSIEEIDFDEANLYVQAAEENDEEWELVDTIVAAGPVSGTPDDGIYSEEERSANASKQIRDGSGKFAKSGTRVMISGNPQAVGTITRVNPSDGTVEVSLESGGTVKVPAKSTKGAPRQEASPYGQNIEVPRVDFSGILGEPRTPSNRSIAQIPGTLPAMTREDLHSVINSWPAWVKSQRDAFIPAAKAAPVNVQAKNSLAKGREGARIEKETGKKLTLDAYDHPLLRKWLDREENGTYPNRVWYNPITAAGQKEKAVTPTTSDVQPLYMAEVASDDPRAVLELISLVPASTGSTSPMTYVRKDGKWIRDPQVLNDLNSATPPPIVPLDSETLNDVLTQVDNAMTASIQPIDVDLVSSWGTPLTAAGGADRNRGGAEKLRRYWTYGPGAAKIRWGSGGDWTRCVRQLSKYMGARSKGYCALRHKEMTGQWTGDKRHRQIYGRRGGGNVFSSDLILSVESIETKAQLVAAANAARERMFGVTASAGELVKGAPFSIPLVIPEGVESGDGRSIEPGALTIRELPIPLLWQVKTADGHNGSVVVGRIDTMERTEAGIGLATGFFDTGVYGAEAERLVRNNFLRGVSADMDQFEAQSVTVEFDDESEEDPKKIQKEKLVINKARIMAVTIVAKPSFQECKIFITETDTPEEDSVIPDGIYMDELDPLDAMSLVACGYVADSIPVAPPREWFNQPPLSGPTPLTVTDEGQVFGHIASWDMDHIGLSFGTRPPRSRSGYKYFNTGILRTDEGEDVTVGQLTLAGGHADMTASAAQAVRHYDDTASAIADVHAGEDQYGIWVAGALRPGTTPEQIRILRASAPSGDWRPINNTLELVAVCQVNVPGFPVARARVASGQVMALVAAGAMTLAKMKSDPLKELSGRLEMLEQFTNAELASQAEALRARMAPAREARAAELSAKASALAERFASLSDGTYVPPAKRAELAATVASLRARVKGNEEFATTDIEEKKITELLEEKGVDVTEENPAPAVEEPSSTEKEGKYTPKTQPRDSQGKFRDVLARLKENLGVSGNQAVIEKLEETENLLGNTGDYVKATESANELIGQIDRLDDGSLNAESIGNVRNATKELGETIANLPLPFDNQAEKVRFSDLPPRLRELTEEFISRVEEKIGVSEAAEATQKLKSFMAGGDMFNQSEVSAELNKLLRLLT
jgi:hypothetical protein